MSGHEQGCVKVEVHAAVDALFTAPLPPAAADRTGPATTADVGHERLERRRFERSAALAGYLSWPDGQHVLRRTCRRIILTTGEIQKEVTYGVTNLPQNAATPAQLEAVWRGHWTMLRNGLVTLLRALGWRLITDALRHYGAYAHCALALLSTSPARL